MCRVRPWLGTIGLQRSTGEAAAESIVSEVGDEIYDYRGIRRKQVQNMASLTLNEKHRTAEEHRGGSCRIRIRN